MTGSVGLGPVDQGEATLESKVWSYMLVFICKESDIPVQVPRAVFLNLWVEKKAVAPHSSTLASKLPWTGELGRLQSTESRRVRHD